MLNPEQMAMPNSPKERRVEGDTLQESEIIDEVREEDRELRDVGSEEVVSSEENKPEVVESFEGGEVREALNGEVEERVVERIKRFLQEKGKDAKRFFSRERVREMLKGVALASLLVIPQTAKAENLFMDGDSSQESTPTYAKPQALQKLDAILNQGVFVVGSTIENQLTPENLVRTMGFFAGGPAGLAASELAGTAIEAVRDRADAEHAREFLRDFEKALEQGGGEVSYKHSESGAVYELRPATPDEVEAYHAHMAGLEKMLEEIESGDALREKVLEIVESPNEETGLSEGMREKLLEELRSPAGDVAGTALSAVMSGSVQNAGLKFVLGKLRDFGEENIPEPWELNKDEWRSVNKRICSLTEHDGKYYTLDYKEKLRKDSGVNHFME